MKVLVTGGGGFLGTEICKQLIERGYQVSSLSRSRYPHLEEMGVESFQCDLSLGEDLVLDDFEAIVHTAAKSGMWGRAEDFNRGNTLATQNILNAAKNAGIKYFIHTSDAAVVFGKEDIENGDESLALPHKYYSDYARTKASAEELVLKESAHGLMACAIRPNLIWGEGDPHIIPRLIAKAREAKLRIVGNGENLVDVIHVHNAALAHVLALEAMLAGQNLGGKAYFIGQERAVNLWEFFNRILFNAGLAGVEKSIGFTSAFYLGAFLEIVFKVFGIKSPEPPMTRSLALRLAKSHFFSHEQARRDFNYSPVVTIEEGLASIFKSKNENLKAISEAEFSPRSEEDKNSALRP